MKALIATILAWFGGDVMQKIKNCIPALVAAAEKAMADGKITAEERKEFVWKCIDIIGAQFGIKITGLMRWVLSILIDSIAKKLPSKDINVPAITLSITKEW